MSRQLEESIVLISSAIDKKANVIGTGFPFYREKIYTYLLTCAHVVEDVGGEENVLVNDIPAKILAIGNIQGFDLAVLRVEGLLNIPLLQLISLSEAENINFQIAGYYLYGEEKKHIQETIYGILDKKVLATQIVENYSEKITVWKLLIDQKDRLRKGYSGAPVVEQKTGFVLGIATNMEAEGTVGRAISIEALIKIWPEMPPTISLELILNNILFSLQENYWKVLKKAYLNCCPKDWQYIQPQNIKEIINDLLDIPKGSNSYGSLIKFVVRLLREPEIKNSDYYQQLKRWGKSNYNDLDKLLADLEKPPTICLQSFLMVYIKKSLQNDNQRYLVSANSPELPVQEQRRIPEITTTILGGIAVAKTTLLTSIYEQFYKIKIQEVNFKFKPDPAIEEILLRNLRGLQSMGDEIIDTEATIGIEATSAFLGPESLPEFAFYLSKTERQLLKLSFRDYPGSYVLKNNTLGREYLKRCLKESDAVILCIDTPAMIEPHKFDPLNRKNWDLLKDKSGRWHDAKNHPQEILDLFKATYTKLKEPKLVILAPVKCETYVQNPESATKLLECVKDKYSPLLKFLGNPSRKDNIAVVTTPVQTVGCLFFSRYFFKIFINPGLYLKRIAVWILTTLKIASI